MTEIILGILALIFTTGVGWLYGRSSKKTKQHKDEIDAHKRIDQADTGADVDDDTRRKRLRDAANKLRD